MYSCVFLKLCLKMLDTHNQIQYIVLELGLKKKQKEVKKKAFLGYLGKSEWGQIYEDTVALLFIFLGA